MAQYPTSGQFGGSWWNNPQMRKQSGAQTLNAGQPGWWNQALTAQMGMGPQQVQATNVQAPQMGNQWQQYLKAFQGQNPITAQNVTAPTIGGNWQQYLNAGTQAINAGAMQDTSALLRSYDPILQRQQEQGFAGAAARAGKTGMWGSPYASALGREAEAASSQRANIANQYLYQASEAQANRQMQAEIQNRANQLQAAGLSAQQAQAQAQMELQAGMSNQQANLQAQIQSRQMQLQAAGLSADQARAQAQMELQAGMANQQAGLTAGQANQQAGLQYGNQLLGGQQQAQQQMQTMMDRFMQQYGDIVSPDDLWAYLSQAYNTGGQMGALPPTQSSKQQPYGAQPQYPNYYQQYSFSR